MELSGKAWCGMYEVYHKMGLGEQEIAERILCKTTKVVKGRKGLDECDEYDK